MTCIIAQWYPNPSRQGSDDDDDAVEGPDFCVAGERLEDDETLRLHVLGAKGYFTKFLGLDCSNFRIGRNTSTSDETGMSNQAWPRRFLNSPRATCRLAVSRCSGWTFARHPQGFRRLEHNKICDDFWNMQCHSLASSCIEPVPNVQLATRYVTFWRRYKLKWANTLRFLPPSTHGTCDVCTDFKERFRRCTEAWLQIVKLMPFPQIFQMVLVQLRMRR